MPASTHYSIICNSGKDYRRRGVNIMVRKLISITNDKRFPLNSPLTEVHIKNLIRRKIYIQPKLNSTCNSNFESYSLYGWHNVYDINCTRNLFTSIYLYKRRSTTSSLGQAYGKLVFRRTFCL
jgi:hypothetical protein